jgi:hypothetical protein
MTTIFRTIGQLRLLYRSTLRRMGKRLASTVNNDEIRYLLDPYSSFRGSSPRVTLGDPSYSNEPPRVHVYDSYVYRSSVKVGRYCSLANYMEFVLGGLTTPNGCPLTRFIPPATR